MERFGLAISEFDSALLTNINFRNPDTFKLNILTSGLEEMRAILSYQLMQKQLLIVATRINSHLIDYFQRSMSELNLVQNKRIVVPNSNLNYTSILNWCQETVSSSGLKQERMRIKGNMTSFCLPIFYSVSNKKTSMRSTIAKEFSNYQHKVV